MVDHGITVGYSQHEGKRVYRPRCSCGWFGNPTPHRVVAIDHGKWHVVMSH